eukprot:scaffold15163_cov125-Isochrysis_galbana.AAC.4
MEAAASVTDQPVPMAQDACSDGRPCNSARRFCGAAPKLLYIRYRRRAFEIRVSSSPPPPSAVSCGTPPATGAHVMGLFFLPLHHRTAGFPLPGVRTHATRTY